MTYIFLNEKESRSAVKNLAINSYIIKNFSNIKKKYDTKSIIRFYKHDNAVILGVNQSIEDTKHEICKEKGFDIVKRPSGGSIVVVSPNSTLCYSIFFENNSSRNIHEQYKNFVIPLVDYLGEGFSVVGNYYIRYNGMPICGHAIKMTKDVWQIDGILHLEKPNMSLFDELFYMRKNGNESEYSILEKCPGLSETRLNNDDFIEAVRKTSENLFGEQIEGSDFNVLEKDLEDYYEKYDMKGKKGLGHCFIDFIEPEEKL